MRLPHRRVTALRPPEPYLLNGQCSLARGLVGFWPGNRGMGWQGFKDISGNQNHGTSGGIGLETMPNPLGGYGVTPTGNMNAIALWKKGTFSSDTQPHSICAWITPIRNAGGSQQTFFLRPSGVGQGMQIGLSNVATQAALGVTGNVPITAGSMSFGQPNLLVGVCDLLNLYLYVNGQLVASQAYVPPTLVYDSVRFAASNNLAWACHFAVWNRALTPTEIAGMYDPDTRWDIYAQSSLRLVVAAAAAATGHQQFLPLLGVA